MKKRPQKLLDQVCEAIRLKHYSMRTEAACVAGTKRHLETINKRPGHLPKAFLKACLRFSNARPLNLFKRTALMTRTLREIAMHVFTVQETHERGGLKQSWH
jgi:hypothetical protein